MGEILGERRDTGRLERHWRYRRDTRKDTGRHERYWDTGEILKEILGDKRDTGEILVILEDIL